ncbi:MAG: hypothetical protein HY594_05030 [Candidatus Omnitrophica bacterium]|nr:hypothetical protein [Candidatus Omnitrophota bacterium]
MNVFLGRSGYRGLDHSKKYQAAIGNTDPQIFVDFVQKNLQPVHGSGLEEALPSIQPGRAIVVSRSAFEQVPGLEEAVAELRAAGLEEQVFILPSGTDALNNLYQRLSGFAVTVYAAPGDSWAVQFQEMLTRLGGAVRRGPLGGLTVLVGHMLRNVGIPDPLSAPDAVRRWLAERALRLAA